VAAPAAFAEAVGWLDGAAGAHRWLVSGPDALRAAGLSVEGTHVFYSDHRDQAAQALAASPGGGEAWLLPLTARVWQERQVLGPAERWVSPYRALADTVCAMGGGEEHLARAWEEAAHG